jgi:ribosomal protein L11 methyltransferase
MSWQEITFELNSRQATSYEDALMSLGALSVTLRDAADQPLLEPAPETTPLWDQVLLTAMFESSADAGLVAYKLKEALELDAVPSYQLSVLEDREWRRTWMDYFEPMQFGRRLWICPSGYERPQQQDAVIVDLDPGLAFGTATHPTTALCMQWLDESSVGGKTIIDFGCGSGVLAIAAAKLGAGKVFAVDTDPQAQQATLENARSNHVIDKITVCEPQKITPGSADILIANILLEPLLLLREQFSLLLKHGGKIVLSGILAEQRRMLETAYSSDFDFQTCEQQEEWVRLVALKH